MEQLFLERYNMLNPEQKKAVDTIDGPVFVMAGPGTGKTQILTLRIANILRSVTDIEPENILALTFTNAAAYNMRDRLSGIIGGELAHRITISTFHSFAEETMKRFPEYFPRFETARLISPVEQIELVESIVNGMSELVHFSKFKRRDSTIKSIIFAIGKIKGEALSADDFLKQVEEKYHTDMDDPKMFYKRAYGEFKKGDIKMKEVLRLDAKKAKSEELAKIYEIYQEQLLKKDLYDFSDLMLSFSIEMSSDSDFQTELQEQYQYILVDEHQDTNDAQNTMLHGLIDNPVWEGKPNVFVVGDTKQAIYRFAGASDKSYSALLSYVKDVQHIELAHNYRSHQNILDHAYELITTSSQHKEEVALQAFFDIGGVMEYRRFSRDTLELLFVAESIQQKIEAGANPNDIAILYRNNKDADDIRHLLSVYDIPVRDFSKRNILKDRNLMKLFLLVRAAHDLEDNEMIAKSLFIDFLGFDVYHVQRVIQAAKLAKKSEKKNIISIISDAERLAGIDIPQDEQEKYLAFADLLKRSKVYSENNDFLEYFSWFIRESGFLNALLADIDSAGHIKVLEKFFDEIRKEYASRVDFEVADFIDYMNTLKKHGVAISVQDSVGEGVQLMTFHGSKGLEFNTVYIIKALHKRKMAGEISLPFEDFGEGEQEDERRLLYVAITRAKHECYISSYQMNYEGREKPAAAFIGEIDQLTEIDTGTWEQENNHKTHLAFAEGNEHVTSLLDQEYIERLFLSKQLSVSALNNYLESPLKYFFRNLIALPEARSHFLDFGNLVHGTLEHYFDKVKEQNKILGEEALIESFDSVIKTRVYYEEFRERAWGILKSHHAYYREQYAIPVENELAVRGIPFEITEGETIFLSGAIDKITRNEDGSLTVWDYKTGRAYSDMDKGRKEKTKRQATFYKLLLQQAYSGRYNFREAVFDFLEPNASGEFEQARFEITQDDVDVLKEQIMKLVQDIKEGTLLSYDFSKDSTNKDLLEFLEVMRGPRTYEQPGLF